MITMIMKSTTTSPQMKTLKCIQQLGKRCWSLAAVLLCCSLVYPSYSNAQQFAPGDTGPNGGVVTDSTVITQTIDEEVELQGDFQITTETIQQTETVTEDVTTTTVTETTSDNLVKNPELNGSTNWTKTQGDVNFTGTQTNSGGTNSQGGTIRQDGIDLFDAMTKTQVNNGFELKYGADVWSHSSNSTVPNCANTTGDCKDSFTITVDIKDSSGNLLHKFEHEFTDISFTGTKTFDFSQTIPANNYDSALAGIELFGMDEGYCCGTYGPGFDNVFMTTTYDVTSIVTEQMTTIIDTVITLIKEEYIGGLNTTEPIVGLDNSFDTVEQPVVETFEVSISDPVSGETVEVEIDVNSISETIAEVTVETDIAPVETFEMEVEVETVETVAEVEAEIEETVSEQVEVEVVETETAESTEENNSNEDSDAKEEPKAQDTKQSKEKQQKAKARIATAIVNNIISKLGSNASDQVTQLILMNAIGAGYKNTKQMPDNNNWYQKVAMYDVKQLPDPAGQMYSFAQDRTMDKLIDLQYQ